MNWTMPYPWRSRRDSVRRINMSSEPGSESFFCALRPIPRILSLPSRDSVSQVQIGKLARPMRIVMARAAVRVLESVLDEHRHLVNGDFRWQNSDVVLPIAVFGQLQFIRYANQAASSSAIPQDPTLIAS